MSKTDRSNEKDTELSDNLGDEKPIPFIRYSLTTWGVDYPVDGLVSRLNNEAIFVPTFQRSYVWTKKQASLFIESLLLGLPVPNIFLSQEAETGKRIVIDGQQRLRTLQYFFGGEFPDRSKFSLVGVQSEFKGRTYEDLANEDRRVLNDSVIHAIVVNQTDPKNDISSIYHIFERLNTGGTLLLPQEIRSCVYHGKFDELLRRLNKETDKWRRIYGKISPRMRDVELILRFLAFRFSDKEYSEPMKGFLNSFMSKYQNLDDQQSELFVSAFTNAIGIIHDSIGVKAFRYKRALNAAIFDSTIVGVSLCPNLAHNCVLRRYESLFRDDAYIHAVLTRTASINNVTTRMKLAKEKFAIG